MSGERREDVCDWYERKVSVGGRSGRVCACGWERELSPRKGNRGDDELGEEEGGIQAGEGGRGC